MKKHDRDWRDMKEDEELSGKEMWHFHEDAWKYTVNDFMKDLLIILAAAVVIGICYHFVIAVVCEFTGKLCYN